MRIRIKLVCLVRQPQPSICVEDFLTKRGEEFFENPATVDSSPEIVKYNHTEEKKTYSSCPNWSINEISMGAFRLISASLSNPSWATIPLRTWMWDLLIIPWRLYLVSPLDIMSFTTKCRKIDTRSSKGIANGILFSIASLGDMMAIWRLEGGRKDGDSDWDVCLCCSSKLQRDWITCPTYFP